MLIPRFSLRLLLLLTTVSGVFFLVVAQAVGGNAWAIAVTTAVSALLATIMLHALVFVLAWVMMSIWRLSIGRQTVGSGNAGASSSIPGQEVTGAESDFKDAFAGKIDAAHLAYEILGFLVSKCEVRVPAFPFFITAIIVIRFQ